MNKELKRALDKIERELAPTGEEVEYIIQIVSNTPPEDRTDYFLTTLPNGKEVYAYELERIKYRKVD